MSWGCYSHRICTDCGNSFKQDMGTLAMKRDDFLKCPYCGVDSVPDEAKNAKKLHKSAEMIEKYRDIQRMIDNPLSILNRKQFTVISESFPDYQSYV